MITLDEVIKNFEEEIRCFEGFKKINAVTHEDYDYIEKTRQLTEWLRELKRLREQELCEDVVSRAEAIRICKERGHDNSAYYIEQLPSVTPKIVRCKDCKHWKQQTNYRGVPFSFGFCESDDMWRSLYGETYEVSHIVTDYDHYCGYAERRTDE